MDSTVSSNGAGPRRCLGYSLMNAWPVPSWPICVHSIIADTTPAVKPTCSGVATWAATSQNRKPRPSAAMRPMISPIASPPIAPLPTIRRTSRSLAPGGTWASSAAIAR